jgi:hypothetical protein
VRAVLCLRFEVRTLNGPSVPGTGFAPRQGMERRRAPEVLAISLLAIAGCSEAAPASDMPSDAGKTDAAGSGGGGKGGTTAEPAGAGGAGGAGGVQACVASRSPGKTEVTKRRLSTECYALGRTDTQCLTANDPGLAAKLSRTAIRSCGWAREFIIGEAAGMTEADAGATDSDAGSAESCCYSSCEVFRCI